MKIFNGFFAAFLVLSACDPSCDPSPQPYTDGPLIGDGAVVDADGGVVDPPVDAGPVLDTLPCAFGYPVNYVQADGTRVIDTYYYTAGMPHGATSAMECHGRYLDLARRNSGEIIPCEPTVIDRGAAICGWRHEVYAATTPDLLDVEGEIFAYVDFY